MKAVSIVGPRQCAIVDAPEPAIAADFVKIKILSAPMCTESVQYRDGWTAGCLGHEAAGEVVEVAQPGRVKVGDRVVAMPQYACGICDLCMRGDYMYCRHGVDPLAACQSQSGAATYAQYMIKPDWLLIPVPDGMSIDHAAMACCGMGPTFGAMQRLSVSADDTVLIVGLGPVGLGGVINARFRNARVIGVDTSPYRSRLAMSLGAEAVVDPNTPDALDRIREMTGGDGVDKAIDCTAAPPAQAMAMAATRRRGAVAFVGWGGKVEWTEIVPSGLSLHGCWHWNLRDAPILVKTIARSGESIDKLITHTFPIDRVQAAWDLQLTRECGKVILRPWE